MSDPCFVCSHNYFCSTHPNNFTRSNPPPLNLPHAAGIFEPRDAAAPSTSLMNLAMSTVNLTAIVSNGQYNDTNSSSEPQPSQVNGPSSSSGKRKAQSNGSGAPIKHSRLNEAEEPSLKSRRKAAEARLANLIQTIDAAATPPETLTVSDVSRRTPVRLRSAACDVWHFITGHDSPCPPDSGHERAELVASDITYQATRPFLSCRRPGQTSPYLRCIPCLANGDWHVWSNRESGVTGAPRDHLWKYHRDKYMAKCKAEGYRTKYDEIEPVAVGIDAPQPAFTREGLVERIAGWVSVADQAMNVADQPEFCEILLYCGQGRISNKDIPHRDKVASEAQQLYLRSKAAIMAEIQAAQGRISLTSDLWTDDLLRSFMAVTAHYIDSQGELAEHLVAFRKIEGSHTGANVGQVLFTVLEEVGIVDKIGQITLDNASNNDTLMVELKRAFASRGLDFDPEENRIRCFPHVINLAVQGYLEALPDAAKHHLAQITAHGETLSPAVSEYLEALDSQPVAACCKTVVACCSTGIRREGLKQTIVEGIASGRFKTRGGDPVQIPVLETVLDCSTRWASTSLMIQRFRLLYLPIVNYLLHNPDTAIPCVTHKQFEVLQDISSVLSVAQRVQQILSTKHTPTLPLTLPLYEHLIEIWKSCRDMFPKQRYAIDIAISKLEEYVAKSCCSPIHALAMFVNPYVKLSWIEEHWTTEEVENAMGTIKARLPKYAQEQHCELVRATRVDAADHAARSQQCGYAHFLALGTNLRRAANPTSLTTAGLTLVTASTGSLPLSRTQSLPSLPSSSGTFVSLTVPEFARSKDFAAYTTTQLTPKQLLAQQKAAVDCEVAGYLALGLLPYVHEGTGTECVNIVRNWKESRFLFPLIHKMAVDILPAQASSVSSERVFSSSKLTVTRDHNRISADLVESLQVLKHSIRRQRTSQLVSRTLDFMDSFGAVGDEVIE